MRQEIDALEQRRLQLQNALDDQKTQAERNRLGQFSTPTQLAVDILRYAAELVPSDEKVQFLDPAIGTGAFFSALLHIFPQQRIDTARGFEIDPHYGHPASDLWNDSELVINLADFTQVEPTPQFNLVICNPPYVRHHHLNNSDKLRLQGRTYTASGMQLSGLAGLYCHFIGLSHAWMADNAIAGWLIPSEFMDVNYGKAVKQYLLNKVTLLHIHRFDPSDTQFADALVSSAIVWFQKASPPKHHTVKFSYGGTLLQPQLVREIPARHLAGEAKWSRFPKAETRGKRSVPTLSDLFHIKRGLVTGANSYFILEREEIASRNLPPEVFRPILPSPRYLQDDEILADEHGMPLLKRQLFLLDTMLGEDEIKDFSLSLYEYIQSGKNRKVHERYLCRHRKPWYAQENRPPPPIVCTYLGRGDAKNGKPFRFIFNNSKATVANVYLAMYPRPILVSALGLDHTLLRRIWAALNHISPDSLLAEGRVYGGGLHKLEPRELAKVEASAIIELLPEKSLFHSNTQPSLFDTSSL